MSPHLLGSSRLRRPFPLVIATKANAEQVERERLSIVIRVILSAENWYISDR